MRYNPGKRGNNTYNERIMTLTYEDWTPYQIWMHIVKDEAYVFEHLPITMTTVYRKAKFYRDNMADIKRYFDGEMSEDEYKVFCKRMKLVKR